MHLSSLHLLHLYGGEAQAGSWGAAGAAAQNRNFGARVFWANAPSNHGADREPGPRSSLHRLLGRQAGIAPQHPLLSSSLSHVCSTCSAQSPLNPLCSLPRTLLGRVCVGGYAASGCTVSFGVAVYGRGMCLDVNGVRERCGADILRCEFRNHACKLWRTRYDASMGVVGCGAGRYALLLPPLPPPPSLSLFWGAVKGEYR